MKTEINHKKILVAPLDWGLGHATRCIPVIQNLLEQNNEVLIAADGAIEKLLKNEFPDLVFVKLFNYNIQYSSSGEWLWWKVLQQIPHLLKCFGKENKWLNNFVEQEKIDVVISDNRYGLFTKKCKNIFITHQLQLQMPDGFKWAESITKNLIEKKIKNFDECWIPDDELEEKSLSGKLSHCDSKLQNIRFIEPLSRFKNFNQSILKIESDVLILISGPEPQRTLLEEKIFSQLMQLKELNKKIIVIGGKVSNNALLNNSSNSVQYFPYVSPAEILSYLLGAKKIICRSGYSTIMDLEAIGKSAIYIPTPGQTEQIYLANRMKELGKSDFVNQHDFQLQNYL